MPIELVTGPANAGKASVLLAGALARQARGERPWLVVPTRADQARYRRELAERGAVMGVRVERFDGLLAEVVARAGVRAAAIGSVARERVLARVAGATPGLARALAEALSEMEAQRVTPARLRGALGVWADARRRSEQLELFGDGAQAGADADGRAALEWVCAAYERYREALDSMGLRDRESRASAALDALRRRPSAWAGTPLLVYGFDDLTELQLDAIQTLGTVVDADVTVSLAYEPARAAFAGRAGSFQRLLPIAARHTQLDARAEHYAPRSRSALHHLERSLLSESPRRLPADDAVRLLEGSTPRAELELVAEEVGELLAGGVPPEQVAIVHRSPQAIAPLLQEVLASRGIPHAIRRRVAFADSAIGRALVGALRCALGEGELRDLLAWLRAPGLLEQPGLADRLEARALREGARSAAAARVLWEAERWPLERIERLAEAAQRSLPALAEALVAELERLFAAPRRSLAPLLDAHELAEAGALAAGRRALEQLLELARRSPVLLPAGEALETLQALAFSVEEDSAGGVLVADPLGLRARRVRALFVCGMQEGVFPAPPSPTLIAEQERRALARASGLVLRPPPDRLAAERYLLYALLSRPEERLTLSWHAASEDGTPQARSLFVDDVCDLFEPIQLVKHPVASAVEVSAPPQTSARSETFARPRSRSERSPAAGAAQEASPIRPLGDERVLAQLRERRLWSASSLELWRACPVKWFVERLLAGDELGPDAEPLARGSLAHAALKATLELLRARTGSARLTPSSLPTAKGLLAEALAELQERHPLSVAPERVPAARRRLLHDLERYLEHAAAQASPLEPTHLELEFGFAEEGPAPLDLGEGVLVRGRIDRIDLGEDGAAIVYDYKGRSAPPSARWLRDGVWQVALYMLAARELLGTRPVGGFYQPLAGRELAPRGALDADADVQLECVRTDRLDRDSFESLLEQCATAARAAAVEARSGALSPRPDSCAYAGGCSYPTICRCER